MTFRYDFNDPDCIKRATGIKGAGACGSNGYVKSAAGSMKGRTIKIKHLGCSYHLDRGSFVDFINSKLPKAEQLEKGTPDVGGASDEQITACAAKVLGASMPLEYRDTSIRGRTARVLLSTLARSASPELRNYMNEQGFNNGCLSDSEAADFFRLHILTAPLALRESVTSLDFGYYKFDEFPSELKIFPNLKKLKYGLPTSIPTDTTGGTSLAGIDELVALEELTIYGGNSLVSMEGVQGLSNLKKVVLHSCHRLQSLSAMEGLTSLEELVIYDGPSLVSIEEVRGLSNLKKVGLWRCPKVQSLAGVEGLAALETLEITKLDSLVSIEGVEGLPNLKRLGLRDCPNLQSLSAIEDVTALEQLHIFIASSKVSSSEFIQLEKMPNLRIVALSRVSGIGKYSQFIKSVAQLLGKAGFSRESTESIHGIYDSWTRPAPSSE